MFINCGILKYFFFKMCSLFALNVIEMLQIIKFHAKLLKIILNA